MGDETETRIQKCRSGFVYGSKPVTVKADLTRKNDFTITCPERGCIAWIVVDDLMKKGELAARCTNSHCRLSPYYQESEC
jgi:hypothetical protein